MIVVMSVIVGVSMVMRVSVVVVMSVIVGVSMMVNRSTGNAGLDPVIMFLFVMKF